MARHLASTRGRVRGGPDGLQEQFGRRDTERKNESTVPVVREEPVVARAQRPRQPEAEGLVASAGNMEKTPALFLQSYFAVVEETRDKGQAIIGEQLGYRDSAVFRPSRGTPLAQAFRLIVAAT